MGSSTTGWAIAFCGLLLGHALASKPALSAPSAEWSLDKQEDGIDVYTRPVEGSGIKEFRGIADIAVDVETILDLLRDSSRFKNWFPNTPESRLLAREGDVTYQYSVMGMPWPMEKRDNVLRAVTRRDAESGIVDIEVTAAPDYYPPQEGRLRIREA
ncbi:MAG TPA: lipid-binding protein, partial [Deltaproteobacteria bacterium]|nr:lipid-binding protein [Deltaproteobacteria bacterium]